MGKIVIKAQFDVVDDFDKRRCL
ncbi:MAG: hypothetical protein M1536_00180 [Firmicutes bacterium]|nr:hypothetical protein [Bacillota bacterium]